MATKKIDWNFQLERAIFKKTTAPFKYGKDDCWTFVVDCVFAMTGELPSIAKAYSGVFSGYRLIRKTGKTYSELAEQVLTEMGFERLAITGAELREGDIVLMPSQDKRFDRMFAVYFRGKLCSIGIKAMDFQRVEGASSYTLFRLA